MATITICDACGSRDDVSRCEYEIPQGDPASHTLAGFDLCCQCEVAVLRRVVRNEAENNISIHENIVYEINEQINGF
jgi:hypothetical protein